MGPTVVDVEVSAGQPLAATVHQGPPTFGPPVPRARAAAVLGLTLDDAHPPTPVPVGTGLDARHRPAGLAAGPGARLWTSSFSRGVRARTWKKVDARPHRPGRTLGGQARGPFPLAAFPKTRPRQRRRASGRVPRRGWAAGLRRAACGRTGRADQSSEPAHGLGRRRSRGDRRRAGRRAGAAGTERRAGPSGMIELSVHASCGAGRRSRHRNRQSPTEGDSP